MRHSCTLYLAHTNPVESVLNTGEILLTLAATNQRSWLMERARALYIYIVLFVFLRPRTSPSMQHESDNIKYGMSYRETAKAITTFAIHTILRVRQVYPPDLFVRRRKYDAPVYQSRHPALNEYIAGAVKAIGEEILLGVVDRIVIVIKDKQERPLERLIFSVHNVIYVDNTDVDRPVVNALNSDSLNLYFRSFLIKLGMLESQLGPLDHHGEITFAIVIECKPGTIPTSSTDNEPVPWMPALKQQVSKGMSPESELIPMRAVETGVINLSLAVQESGEKLRHNLLQQRSQGSEHSTEADDDSFYFKEKKDGRDI
ncbi:DNA-binding protein [Cantharellus anzutake]|uniref:DNA-binding protein n=1 Tax=Cantharellus anzutake TaxID=1750568 RepID=UPI001903F9B2|nr:DNA-binding protein [Cantharellus anzutake]KAF8338099.1 DNA-binding protein [Cantharellus anzutake]